MTIPMPVPGFLPIAAWSGDDAVAMLAERAERWRIRCEVATRRAELAEQERDYLSDLAADATAKLLDPRSRVPKDRVADYLRKVEELS
jgi:hypothetical protein